ncbi:MAG: hypothetical protein DMG40_01010 [Acidobacteria bacterium]|nr:MAG: hypothetical protein DMG40_01010 [Acidobacteriota bacterium]
MKAKARNRFYGDRRVWFALFSIVALFFLAAPLCAQVDTGAILGTVTDQSGAVIAGATVSLKNEGTKSARLSRDFRKRRRAMSSLT